MAEYIERDKAKKEFSLYFGGVIHAAIAIRLLDEVPAADVVEVPCHCKDCKYWKHFDHVGCSDYAKVCMLANYMIGPMGYCLYGERTDDEGDEVRE